jgi:hypothetical protein
MLDGLSKEAYVPTVGREMRPAPPTLIETVRGIDGCAMASDRGYDLLPTLTPKPPAR